MVHNSGRRSQLLSQQSGVANITVVIGDHAAVGTERDIPQRHRADASHRRVQAEGEQFQRNRSAQDLDWLRLICDDDEAICRDRDEFLAGVRRAAAFDQPTVRRDLVGAVDRDVEPLDVTERLDPDA